MLVEAKAQIETSPQLAGDISDAEKAHGGVALFERWYNHNNEPLVVFHHNHHQNQDLTRMD